MRSHQTSSRRVRPRRVDRGADRVRERLVPAAQRVVVVRAGVGDPVLAVVGDVVHVAGRARHPAELEHDHAGQAERVAQPLDRRRDDAQVLGDDRQRAERRARVVEQRAARARGASGPPARGARRAAPTSRRRSRGSGRSVPGRRARTSAPAARPTSGSRCAAARASRRAGCPTAGPCRCRRRAACRRRRRRGTARGGPCGRPSRGRRRSARRRSAGRRARSRRCAAPSTRARTAPGRRRRRGRRSAPSPRSTTPRARGSPAPRPAPPAPTARRAGPATRRTPSAPCRASRSGRAGRAAASATTTAPPRRASRPTRTPRAPAGRPAARWDGAARRTSGGDPRRGRVRRSRNVCPPYRAALESDTSARTHMPMPKGNRSSAPARIHIQYPQPVVDAGRYPPSGRSATSSRSRSTSFRDGHEKLRAVVLHRRAGDRKWAEAELHQLDAHHNGVRWGGSFVVDRTGRWEWTIEAWTDLFATWRDELRRKLEGGQHDLSGELSEGVVLLEAAASARQGPGQEADRARARRPDRHRGPRGGQARRGARPRALRRRRAQRRASRSGAARAGARPRGRPRARALRLLVRAVPALLGRARGRAGAAARRSPSSASTSSTSRRSTRSARRTARAGTTCSSPRPEDPGSPYGIGSELRRSRRGPPRARHPRGRPRAVRRRRRARHRHRARLRDQRVARPSVAQGASGLVPPPPGRDAQVRREPAQEVPGHLQRQLGHRGLARAVGRAAADRPACGSSSA